MLTLMRLGRKRRLALRLEWLTLCPTWAPLPVSSHRRDMGENLDFSIGHAWRARGFACVSIACLGRPRTYNERAAGRQAARADQPKRPTGPAGRSGSFTGKVPAGRRAHRFCLDRDKMTRQEIKATEPPASP